MEVELSCASFLALFVDLHHCSLDLQEAFDSLDLLPAQRDRERHTETATVRDNITSLLSFCNLRGRLRIHLAVPHSVTLDDHESCSS